MAAKYTTIQLPAYSRGFHLITSKVTGALGSLPETGMLHLFIQHTSAGLTINENADPSVRRDMERYINSIVPEDFPGLEHTIEGPDDMPGHVKASFFGSSLNIPIINHRLALGTWQGIYLCEFRNSASGRRVLAGIFE